jgi:hypothetical protein
MTSYILGNNSKLYQVPKLTIMHEIKGCLPQYSFDYIVQL